MQKVLLIVSIKKMHLQIGLILLCLTSPFLFTLILGTGRDYLAVMSTVSVGVLAFSSYESPKFLSNEMGWFGVLMSITMTMTTTTIVLLGTESAFPSEVFGALVGTLGLMCLFQHFYILYRLGEIFKS